MLYNQQQFNARLPRRRGLHGVEAFFQKVIALFRAAIQKVPTTDGGHPNRSGLYWKVVFCLAALALTGLYCYNNRKSAMHHGMNEVSGSSSGSSSITLIPNHCVKREEAAEKFDEIAKSKTWGGDAIYGSKSGPGSNINAVYPTVLHIDKFITDYDIKSFADIPCGDVNWQGSSKKLNTIDVYFGGDISGQIIAENEKTFAQHHNKVFRDWDLVQCPVPQYQLTNDLQPQSFELVMTRDVIQHLPLSEGLQFVRNVVLSPGIKYWAVTSYQDRKGNDHAISGDVNKDMSAHLAFYGNNMDIEPFNLPKENIVFQGRSHPDFMKAPIDADLFVVYKIDENMRNIVKQYDV